MENKKGGRCPLFYGLIRGFDFTRPETVYQGLPASRGPPDEATQIAAPPGLHADQWGSPTEQEKCLSTIQNPLLHLLAEPSSAGTCSGVCRWSPEKVLRYAFGGGQESQKRLLPPPKQLRKNNFKTNSGFL